MKLKTFLLDSKKAVAAFSVGVSAAVANGLLPGHWGEVATAGSAVLSTVLVYGLDNLT